MKKITALIAMGLLILAGCDKPENNAVQPGNQAHRNDHNTQRESGKQSLEVPVDPQTGGGSRYGRPGYAG